MNINYFSDTDTALLEFSEMTVAETVEISENLYIDLDETGNPVSLTIEHASIAAKLPNISYNQIEEQKKSA
jgi:uncharacterized protein YuzE